MTMEKAYVELDKEDLGYLTYDDLADKFIALGVTLTKAELVSLAADIDTDNDQRISKVSSFLFCFTAVHRRSDCTLSQCLPHFLLCLKLLAPCSLACILYRSIH